MFKCREVESQLAAILEARNQAIPSLKLALQEAGALLYHSDWGLLSCSYGQVAVPDGVMQEQLIRSSVATFAEAARTTEVSRFVSAVSSSVLTPGK